VKRRYRMAKTRPMATAFLMLNFINIYWYFFTD
jgi:hypothetical protein